MSIDSTPASAGEPTEALGGGMSGVPQRASAPRGCVWVTGQTGHGCVGQRHEQDAACDNDCLFLAQNGQQDNHL